MVRSARPLKGRMLFGCGSLLVVLEIYNLKVTRVPFVEEQDLVPSVVPMPPIRIDAGFPSKIAIEQKIKFSGQFLANGKSLIHVCFTPEESDEQLSRMILSMRSILFTAKPATRQRLVFHILGKDLTSLDGHLSLLSNSGLRPKDIKVYRKATDHVPKNRAVHSTFKELAKDEVYVRFFIPRILDNSVDKFLYLDTDTIVLSDLSNVYDRALKGKYTLAAGVQNMSFCTLGKMLDLTDERLIPLGIKDGDKCLSGGAFFVDRWRWEKENRTQRWQYWIDENFKKKLYYLGSIPPQMIDFHNQWEQLPSSWLLDFKGHKCCPPKFSKTLLSGGKSVIVYPFKSVKDPGEFKRLLDINDDLTGYEL